MKKRILGILLTGAIMMSMTGCFASLQNDKTIKGGYLTTSKADYIVLNESGGTIMDCWILEDVYVESESTSDGVRFGDKNGNGVVVQGDAKIIRINNKTDISKYVEYHKEIDVVSYEEFYKAKMMKSNN